MVPGEFVEGCVCGDSGEDALAAAVVFVFVSPFSSFVSDGVGTITVDGINEERRDIAEDGVIIGVVEFDVDVVDVVVVVDVAVELAARACVAAEEAACVWYGELIGSV